MWPALAYEASANKSQPELENAGQLGFLSCCSPDSETFVWLSLLEDQKLLISAGGSTASITQPTDNRHWEGELWKRPAAIPKCSSRSTQVQKDYPFEAGPNGQPTNHELNKLLSLIVGQSVPQQKPADTRESDAQMAPLEKRHSVQPRLT